MKLSTLRTILTYPARLVRSLLDPSGLRKVKGIDGEELDRSGAKPVYIVACRGWNKATQQYDMVRLGTHSIDHLRSNLRRFANEDIFYLARRRGRRFRDVKAIAVFSTKMEKVVCTKDQALQRLLA